MASPRRESGEVITAVDTSVPLDVFGAGAVHGPRSAEALRSCFAEGQVIACDVVWTTGADLFPSPGREEASANALWRISRSALSEPETARAAPVTFNPGAGTPAA